MSCQPFLLLLFVGALLQLSFAELLQTQVIFRHGDRMPEHYLYLPSDVTRPPWEGELGELTMLGTQQEYQLGKRLRQMYPHLLAEQTFALSRLLVISGADNRTSASAMAVTHGMFPQFNKHDTKTGLPTHVHVPLHIEPLLDLATSGMMDIHSCPLLATPLHSDVRWVAIQEREKSTVEYLRRKAGLEDVEPFNTREAGRVLDNLQIRKDHAATHPLPRWSQEGPFNASTDYENMRCVYERELFLIPIINRPASGYLHQLFTTEMTDFARANTNHELVLWSAHDSTISLMLWTFDANVDQNVNPGYGANLHLQLHNDSDGLTVKAFYSNRFDASARPIEFSHCATPCTLSAFIAMAEPYTTYEYTAACRGIPKEFLHDVHVIVLVLSVVCALLVVALTIVSIAFIARCRKYKSTMEERKSLLSDDYT